MCHTNLNADGGRSLGALVVDPLNRVLLSSLGVKGLLVGTVRNAALASLMISALDSLSAGFS